MDIILPAPFPALLHYATFLERVFAVRGQTRDPQGPMALRHLQALPANSRPSGALLSGKLIPIIKVKQSGRNHF